MVVSRKESSLLGCFLSNEQNEKEKELPKRPNLKIQDFGSDFIPAMIFLFLTEIPGQHSFLASRLVAQIPWDLENSD